MAFFLILFCKPFVLSYAFDESNINNDNHKIFFITNYKELKLQYHHQIANDMYYLNNSNNVNIHYERTGGIRGETISLTIDVDSLSLSEQQQIKKILDNSDFFNLNSNTNSPPGAADFFTYTITIANNNTKHTVSVNDITMPNNLIPLIEFIEKKSMSSNNQ
jgi:hypothetical protein